MTLLLRRCIPLLILLLATFPLVAHEIGTTQVRVNFLSDHTYRIDIVTAPQSLLNRLETKSGAPRSSDLAEAELQRRLQTRAPAIVAASAVRFGETGSTPKVNVLPIAVPADPNAATYVIVRLTGDVPPHAGAFTWRYDLTYATYALTIAAPGAQPVRQWLDGGQTSAPFPVGAHLATPSRAGIFRQYLALGFTHILPYGLDHILFVLGMFLLSARLKPVLTQVTTFTVAHSITLALTMYGLLSVSPRIVEPLIALSIAYVAIENLTTTQLKPWRVAIVFGFGLLHGLGFGGVLRELGLPRGEFVTALLAFNAGVELGQIAVIAVAWLAFVSWAERRWWYRERLVVPASMFIAAMGLFWMVERLL